jgi:HAD superfamily hydrolase (TIGR01509 family)
LATQLVIFDCDGVLVNSEPLANAVFARHLNRLGLPYTGQSAMNQFMGKSLKTCLLEVAEQLKSHSLPIPADFPSAFEDAMQKDTFEVLAREVQAVAGVADAIRVIQSRGFKTCVASSGDHHKMTVTLGKTQLASLFTDRIFSATQVARGKPEPDLFLFAAKQMGVQPRDCLVVEDSPFGLMAAVAAGMKAVGYANLTDIHYLLAATPVAQAYEAGQVVVIKDMQELPNFVFH